MHHCMVQVVHANNTASDAHFHEMARSATGGRGRRRRRALTASRYTRLVHALEELKVVEWEPRGDLVADAWVSPETLCDGSSDSVPAFEAAAAARAAGGGSRARSRHSG